MRVSMLRRFPWSPLQQHLALVVFVVLCSSAALLFHFSRYSLHETPVQHHHHNDVGAAAGGDDGEEEEMLVKLGRGSLDASERYWVHRLVALPEEKEKEIEVVPCLALHASLGQTHHVVQQARLWDSSLSLAVFVAPEDRGGARVAITVLRRCFPLVKQKVTFHVVYPANFSSSSPFSDGHYEDDDDDDRLSVPPCPYDITASPESILRALETRLPDHGLPYPQNLMRNVARASCPGPYSLVADVDMLPPGDGLLANRLRTFLASEQAQDCHKCAFTLPVFEVHGSVTRIPRDKQELRALASRGKARPFHWQLFRKNQRALEPHRWLAAVQRNNSSEDSAKSLGLAFNVSFEFRLEPVYVAARGAPVYDEGFVGFGFTRNTQAYEMILAGWRFVVLDDAFLVHQGFQWSSRRPPWRSKEVMNHARDFKMWLRRTVAWYDRDPNHVLQEADVTGLRMQVIDPRWRLHRAH